MNHFALKILALLAAQYIDANSTTHALRLGNGVEINPIMHPFAGNTARNMAGMVLGDGLAIVVLGHRPALQNAYIGAAIVTHAMASIHNNNVTRDYLSH